MPGWLFPGGARSTQASWERTPPMAGRRCSAVSCSPREYRICTWLSASTTQTASGPHPAMSVARHFDPYSPDAVLPFESYRRLGSSPMLRDVPATLVHFYESEKFRGVDETLRLEVLDCSSVSAARKLAKRNRAHWRENWSSVRGRAFRAGLAMQIAQSKTARLAAKALLRDLDAVSSSRLYGGLPGLFVAKQTSVLFEEIRSPRSLRMGFVVFSGHCPVDLVDRLDAVAGAAPFSGTVYAGPEAEPLAEQWLQQRAVPVKLVGSDSSRFRLADHSALLQRVNALVVCAPSSRTEVAELVAQAKAKRIRVLDFTMAGTGTGTNSAKV